MRAFLYGAVLCVVSLACSAADHNTIPEIDKQFACLPTILRNICALNKDHAVTKQLLACMKPHTSVKEVIQKLDIRGLVPDYYERDRTQRTCEQTLQWYAGYVTMHGMLQRGELNSVSPETTARLARELCEYVFDSKQPAEHPYNAVEEENNWLSAARFFPMYASNADGTDDFARLFTVLMKRSFTKKLDHIGIPCRDLAKAIYLLHNPGTERMILGHTFRYIRYMEGMVRDQITAITTRCDAESSQYDKTVKEKWFCCKTEWVECLMRTTTQEALRNGFFFEISAPLQKEKYFERLLHVQGMITHSHLHEQRLKEHIQSLQTTEEPCIQICDARDTEGALVHRIYDHVTPGLPLIAYVAALPDKKFIVQGVGEHASGHFFGYKEVPFPDRITAVVRGYGEWKLEDPQFTEISLVFGCADGSVVFLKHSEFFRSSLNPTNINIKVFKVADGPIEHIAPGPRNDIWLFACKDSIIVWLNRINEVLLYDLRSGHDRWEDIPEKRCKNYVIPDIGIHKIDALRSDGCFIVYKLSDCRYGTIIPYTSDEYDEYSNILVNGTEEKQREFGQKLDRKDFGVSHKRPAFY